jgi:hypothetical protein
VGAGFSRIKIWVEGEILTAADINAEFNNIFTNLTPAGIDDEAASLAAFQANTDPYPAGVASLPTSLQGDLQRLRYLIKQITGEGQWYVDPDSDIATLKTTSDSHTSSIAVLDSYRDRMASVYNLKMARHGTSNNVLLVQTKSGGAVPDSTNYISIAIPDGTGNTLRTRNAAVASGQSQFTLADATTYWNIGSADGYLVNAYLYAIWSAADSGIVWALNKFSGFLEVPTTTTETDLDYFLLEDGSTYTRQSTDYCVCVGRIRAEYDTSDTPNWTIQTAGEDAPIVMYNPKSDYSNTVVQSVDVTGTGADIAEQGIVSIVIKQTGMYEYSGQVSGYGAAVASQINAYIKSGHATYGSATQRATAGASSHAANLTSTASIARFTRRINAGDTVHLGGAVARASASGDTKMTNSFLTIVRID